MLEDKNQNRTALSNLGEFGLIDHLTSNFKIKNSTTITGIGDDAAVLNFKDKSVVVTTDFLVEGVHFDLSYMPLKHLGYKAVVVNLSDVYAMNAMASQVTVSIAVSNRFTLESMEALYDGINKAAKFYGVDVVGGDTTSSISGLTISVTAIGHVSASEVVKRNGAKPNDLLVLTGDIGAAYLGLQVLEREKEVFKVDPNNQPDLDNYTYLIERQLKPEARVDIVAQLDKQGTVPSSMIDLSDGLSSDLRHICINSNVGVKIFENKIPILKETKRAANELGVSPVFCALHGGEDYELLFTAPASLHEKLKLIDSVSAIGHITSEKEKVELITSSDESIDLTSEGWDSFFKKK